MRNPSYWILYGATEVFQRIALKGHAAKKYTCSTSVLHVIKGRHSRVINSCCTQDSVDSVSGVSHGILIYHTSDWHTSFHLV